MSATPLGARDRLFLDRFSFGHTKQLAKQVHQAGGGRAWFEKQLRPDAIKDKKGAAVKGWFPTLWHSPRTLWNHQDSAPGWELMTDLSRWTMMRRVYSSHQLHEVMVDFWSNLLHIPLGDDNVWPYRVAYDKLIRAHALGRFDDMLVKAITHPSMGLSLDNAYSTKYAPNENLGRELLELHTVGVDAGYTERDVKMSSRMLTGYRVELWDDSNWGASYEKDWHWTGTIKVMGFKSTNRSADGRKATEKYLRYLAHHPKTAKRIATRLCVKFVHDNPSAGLVNHVASAWTRSGTDIKTTLRAMVSHPEFLGSGNQKVRMPLEETIATIRGLGIKPHKPTDDNNSFANALHWAVSSQGMTPYGWPAPNGFPEVNIAWSSPGRALDSLNAQLRYASLPAWGTGGWMTTDVSFRSYHSFLPPLPASFGSVINHMSLELLGEPASARVKDGISLRTGLGLHKRVGRKAMDDNRVRQILIALLGTPAHLTR